MGVASKDYEPSIALKADSAGFWRQGRIMLSVRLHCLISRHQFAMGKEVESPAMPAVKWFFHVRISCLAGFVWCMSGGVYCTLVCLPEMKSLMSLDVSLSILCRSGLNPLLVRYA